ncbi:MAG: 16S rRNA (cytidine(1402)-2'-O)-methyltransferase [Chloroflexi bacterium]|nr:16S rRNA (cytidine(1402)-2'-O)-methyltransferase [Chloroflexota bacterium]
MNAATGTLTIVATPIGNPDDISARALQALGSADWIVCEEMREGERLLRRHGIKGLLVDLNEHNEKERTAELTEELRQGKTLALISDAGTPLFYDPGQLLVTAAYELGAKVTTVPGPSSLMAALVLSNLPIKQFRVVGMLPANHEARRQALRALQNEPLTVVLLDAPYRLQAVLADLVEVVGADRPLAIACNLTMPGEQVVRGRAAEVLERFRRLPFKGEYVIVVAGATSA